MPDVEEQNKQLPPPWDRIFSLTTRLFVWGLLAGIVYILRPFFLMVFLTFVFAYVQAHGVDGLGHRIKNRIVRVILVFLVFVGTIGSVGYFLVPHLQDQAVTIGRDGDKWLDEATEKIKVWAEDVGFDEKMTSNLDLKKIVQEVIGLGDPEQGESALKKTMERLQSIFTPLLAISSAFLLSLLFSFLIVLDLPKLTRHVSGLSKTKVGFIYNEVAGNIYHFSKVLGRAMEAQLIIAMANTALTAIGLTIIGLTSSMVFLCTLVFLCSFIPVAGVFISSTPICIVALQESGFGLMIGAIVMILVIHFIEAYFLNPQIYGAHLRMNPVLTLIILTVCGKLFGFWGLILGIPILNYLFAHAIRYQSDHRPPAAAAT